MQLKKNPELETNRYSTLIFNMMLLLLLFITNTAFEWRVQELPEKMDLVELENTQITDNEEIMIITKLDVEKEEL